MILPHRTMRIISVWPGWPPLASCVRVMAWASPTRAGTSPSERPDGGRALNSGARRCATTPLCSSRARPAFPRGPPRHERADGGHARPGLPRVHPAAVRGSEEGLPDRARPGVPLPGLRHRRLGGGPDQHPFTRRSRPGRADRPVFPSVDRHVQAHRPGRGRGRLSTGAKACRSSGSPRSWPRTRRTQIKAVLVTQNETATGVTSDVAGVRAALDAVNHPALLFVDGVSSIASIDFRMDEWGVDVAVSGSQKGFMLPTGLAIVASARRRWPRTRLPSCSAAISTSPT